MSPPFRKRNKHTVQRRCVYRRNTRAVIAERRWRACPARHRVEINTAFHRLSLGMRCVCHGCNFTQQALLIFLGTLNVVTVCTVKKKQQKTSQSPASIRCSDHKLGNEYLSDLQLAGFLCVHHTMNMNSCFVIIITVIIILILIICKICKPFIPTSRGECVAHETYVHK